MPRMSVSVTMWSVLPISVALHACQMRRRLGGDEARRTEEIGLPHPAFGHFRRVVLEAEMGPDEIEFVGADRDDLPR